MSPPDSSPFRFDAVSYLRVSEVNETPVEHVFAVDRCEKPIAFLFWIWEVVRRDAVVQFRAFCGQDTGAHPGL